MSDLKRFMFMNRLHLEISGFKEGSSSSKLNWQIILAFLKTDNIISY